MIANGSGSSNMIIIIIFFLQRFSFFLAIRIRVHLYRLGITLKCNLGVHYSYSLAVHANITLPVLQQLK